MILGLRLEFDDTVPPEKAAAIREEFLKWCYSKERELLLHGEVEIDERMASIVAQRCTKE